MGKVVAVIGASSDPRKFGNRAVRAFRRQGYTVIPINPNESQVEGLKTYASVLDVRLLSAVDLAVSKISRFTSQDRGDIETLAKHGLIRSAPLRKRAEEAAGGYVGNLDNIRSLIDLTCRIVNDIEKGK